MNNVIFIHAGNMVVDKFGFPNQDRCQKIINEITTYIIESEIYKDVKFINLELIGNKNISFDVPKGNVNYNGPDHLQYEFVTLQKIIDYSKNNPDDNILYIHTKGSSSSKDGHEKFASPPPFQWIEDVRNYQLYQTITRYKLCLEMLKEYDTCGAELIDHPVKHYSQNFWWAKASHINTLIHPSKRPIIFDYRHNCEFWICSNPNGKYKSIFNLYDHFETAVDFSKELYINKESNII